jgi:transposase InsO family protein
MVKDLLQAVHNDPMSGGHFSFERTYNKLRGHYWWPGMRNTIRHHIKSCNPCQTFNITRQKKVGHLHSIPPPDGPFQIIGIDFCGPLKTTPRGNKYVLVITDYFTRHITAIPLPTCTAAKTAEALFNDFFCKFGVPETIVSDQGTHFQNQLMTNMRRLIGYNHIYSTPYHPQSNGIVERFNSTFISQISKLQDNEQNNWDEYLQAVVFAYNSGIHKTTRYSPYHLLFGRPPRLPFHSKPSHFSFPKPNDYFIQLKKTLKYLHQSARNNILRQQDQTKTYYDTNRLDPKYKVGDRVLTRIPGMKGKLDPLFYLNPKVIIHVQHPSYIVRDTITNVKSRVHVSDIKPILID